MWCKKNAWLAFESLRRVYFLIKLKSCGPFAHTGSACSEISVIYSAVVIFLLEFSICDQNWQMLLWFLPCIMIGTKNVFADLLTRLACNYLLAFSTILRAQLWWNKYYWEFILFVSPNWGNIFTYESLPKKRKSLKWLQGESLYDDRHPKGKI